MYCPKCRYEYRNGFTVCPDCEVDLVETLEKERSNESLITIFEVYDRAKIERAQQILSDNGIQPCINNNSKLHLGFPTGQDISPGRVQVLESDVERAIAVLKENYSYIEKGYGGLIK